MRIFLSLLLLLPAGAFAVGVEYTAYYGLSAGKTVVKLAFLDDPTPWSKGNFIFGNKRHKPFSFCWAESVNEVPQSLVCRASPTSKPSVVYRALPYSNGGPFYNERTAAGAEYRAIARRAKLGDGTGDRGATLVSVYVCQTGCSAEMPRYFFETIAGSGCAATSAPAAPFSPPWARPKHVAAKSGLARAPRLATVGNSRAPAGREGISVIPANLR